MRTHMPALLDVLSIHGLLADWVQLRRSFPDATAGSGSSLQLHRLQVISRLSAIMWH